MNPATNIPASTLALRRLFQWIESRYGGNIPMERGASAAVLRSEANVISTAHLEQLLRHEAVALHVPAFYPPHTARQLGLQLAQEAMDGRHSHRTDNASVHSSKPQQRPQNWKISTSRGLESSDVTTLGAHVPYNVALTSSSSSSSIDEYFAGVQVELQSRRYRYNASDREGRVQGQVEPQLWPLDLLRLQLDEAWPYGAGLARDARRNQPFGGGLPRIMHATTTRWKRGLIHVDELGPLRTSEGLFSANIYLQVPPSVCSASASDTSNDNDQVMPETVLQIWPTSIRSRWDWYRNALLLSCLSAPQDAESQAKLRRALGGDAAAQSVAVRPGDLVLFCVQRPHAAVGFGANVEHASASTALTRVSLQCFIQHAGQGKRLLIDC
jgi:hypothetical protein